MSLPWVTCLMPTYKRFPQHAQVVQEALQSFLQQDYPNKELIILNDAVEQHLQLDQQYDNVYLINVPRRFRTLGEKLNAMAAMSRGEYLTRWDDDDISLPWRIRLCVERRPADSQYWKPNSNWYYPTHELKWDHNYMSHAFYTRGFFDDKGGYPHVSVREDMEWERIARDAGTCREFEVTMEETPYLYRWGDGSWHVSGFPDCTGYDKMAGHAINRGMFTLQPGWARDYVALTRKAASSGGYLQLQG